MNLVSELFCRLNHLEAVGADYTVQIPLGHMYKFQKYVVAIYSYYYLGAKMDEMVQEEQEKDVPVAEVFSTFDCGPMLNTSS